MTDEWVMNSGIFKLWPGNMEANRQELKGAASLRCVSSSLGIKNESFLCQFRGWESFGRLFKVD